MLERVQSSAAIAASSRYRSLGDIGIALLGIAALKAGRAPLGRRGDRRRRARRGEPGGATGTKALVIISFALLFVGLLQTVRTLAASPSPQLAAAGTKAAALS